MLRVTYESAKYYDQIIREINNEHSSCNEIRIFIYEHVRYIFNHRYEQFERMKDLDEVSTTNQLIHSNNTGIGGEQRQLL